MPLDICAVSPSDMVGQVDNLLSRIEALEQAVAELQSQNVSAIQLSDLSQSGGWLYDVTYLGMPGWTQTAAGTLIPPPGVSLSSLGILPNASQLYSSGSGISGVGLSTALFQATVGAIADGPGGTSFSWSTIINQSFAVNNTTYITLADGVYLLTVGGGTFSRSSTASTTHVNGYIGSNVVGNSQIQFGHFFATGESTISKRGLSGAVVSEFPDALSNSDIYGFAQKTGTAVSLSIAMLGISKLA